MRRDREAEEHRLSKIDRVHNNELLQAKLKEIAAEGDILKEKHAIDKEKIEA